MIENDPHRCARCRVYVRPDVAETFLRVSHVEHRSICRDVVECDTRIKLVGDLDRLVGKLAA